MITQIAVAVVVLLVVASVSPPARRFFKSFILFFNAKVDSAAEAIGSTDALGQYKSQILDNAEKGKMAQKVVETAASQLVSLKSQINEDLKDKKRLESRISSVLAAGDPNKTVNRLALDLERVERNIELNTAQLTSAQASYDENLNLVQRFENKIVELRRDVDQLGFQLEQSEAEKNLARATATLKGSMNVSDLSDVRNKVLAQINANKGSAMANQDLADVAGDDADEDLERNNRAEEILKRFKTQTPASN